MKQITINHNKIIIKISIAAVLIALIILASITLGRSYAWFESKSTVVNEVSTNYDTTTTEKFPPPTPGDWEEGNPITKEVAVQNTGNTDTYIRVHYAERLTDESGNYLSLQLSNGERAVNIDFPNDFNSNWHQGVDGWYYYKAVLKAGETSELFIEGVSLNKTNIPTDRLSSYQQATYDLDMVHESVQAAPADAIRTVWGIEPPTGDEDDLTWTIN